MKAPIGARVSIRFHDPEGGFRDLVGYLESENTLRNRHGELIEFDREKIAIYKVIEEINHLAGHGAPLSLRVQELENVLTTTWPPVNQELFGKWLLRTSGKFTMRANSVLPSGKAPYGEPLKDIDQAIGHVVEHYEKAGLVPTFAIPLPIYQELDSKLFDNGWIEKVRAHVMVADIAHHAPSFAKCDVIAGPASPSPAFKFGGMNDPLKMYLCDVYTVNTNIAGLPAISLPIGFAKDGARSLPIGLHLQAPAFADAKLLRAARMVEKLFPDLVRQAPDFS